jgi:acyl-CoA thioesterase-1
MIMRAPVLDAVRVFLLIGLSLVLLHRAESAPRAPTVLVLGDSISAAYGMSLEQGWVALLENRLRRDWTNAEVVNASISGDTSDGGLRRLPSLLEKHSPALVVIELGGNDGLRGYPTSRLEDNLSQMAALARSSGAQVVILPMEIPPNYGPRYTRAFRQAFENAAAENNATLGPFILEGIATEPSLMQPDGIHPTAAAQPLITELLTPLISGQLAEQDPS